MKENDDVVSQPVSACVNNSAFLTIYELECISSYLYQSIGQLLFGHLLYFQYECKH